MRDIKSRRGERGFRVAAKRGRAGCAYAPGAQTTARRRPPGRGADDCGVSGVSSKLWHGRELKDNKAKREELWPRAKGRGGRENAAAKRQEKIKDWILSDFMQHNFNFFFAHAQSLQLRKWTHRYGVHVNKIEPFHWSFLILCLKPMCWSCLAKYFVEAFTKIYGHPRSIPP